MTETEKALIDEIDTRKRLEKRLEKCEAALKLYLEHFGDPLKCIRSALE